MKNKSLLKIIKVSQKGQIAIPAEVQKMTGIKKGDNLILFIKGKKIMLEKVDTVIAQVNDDFKDVEIIREFT